MTCWLTPVDVIHNRKSTLCWINATQWAGSRCCDRHTRFTVHHPTVHSHKILLFKWWWFFIRNLDYIWHAHDYTKPTRQTNCFKMWQVYKGMIIFNIWWSLNFEMFNDLFKTRNWYNLKNSYTFVCVEMHDFWIEKILFSWFQKFSNKKIK